MKSLTRPPARPFFRSLARLLGCALLLACAGLNTALAAKGSFEVVDVSVNGLDGRTRVQTEMELRLSERVEEAVNNGIPIRIAKQYAVPVRRLIFKWKRRQVRWRRDYQLRRHALSGRYIVTNSDTELVKTYPTVDDALRSIGAASTVTLQLDEGDYSDPPRLAVRIYLDISALPTALRLRSLLSRKWRHNSGWSQWPIEP